MATGGFLGGAKNSWPVGIPVVFDCIDIIRDVLLLAVYVQTNMLCQYLPMLGYTCKVYSKSLVCHLPNVNIFSMNQGISDATNGCFFHCWKLAAGHFFSAQTDGLGQRTKEREGTRLSYFVVPSGYLT